MVKNHKSQSINSKSNQVFSSNLNMKIPSNFFVNLTNFTRVQNVAYKVLPNAVSIYSKKDYSVGGGLLKYPALKLDETMTTFLKSTKPLLTEAEYKETEDAAKYFLENDGKDLQKILEGVASKEKNWLADRWLKTAYLQYRDPVTVFSSPGMTFPVQIFGNEEKWLEYSASVINGMGQFKLNVDQGKIPIQKMGKLELDNSQFGKIFGTNRRPARFEDELIFHPDSKHVVVLYKNHFFKVPIITEDCKPISTKLIKNALTTIVKSIKDRGPEIGLLTTDNRDNWAEAYAALQKQKGNDKILHEIESSLFTVSLDECVSFDEKKVWDEMSRQTIHGGGSKQNSANRWMDKTIQLIINANGISGFTYEHSPAEGQGIAAIIDFVVEKLADPNCLGGEEPKKFCVQHLQFADPNPCIEQWIETARRNINQLSQNLDVCIYNFEDFGKNCIKHLNFSPDSFIQVSFQLAFYRLLKTPGAQYETAHLRIFDGGRTETIRSCSLETLAFAKAMLSEVSCVDERCELLAKAVNGHREYTNMALHGKGVDRHLLGLKLMALENKQPVPKFYSSPGFKKSSNFRISTSQVASKLPVFMSYGPAAVDGYACCYNPRDNDIILAVTSWKSSSLSAKQFAKAIADSLSDMFFLANDCKAKLAPTKSKL